MNNKKKLVLIFGNGPLAVPAEIDEYIDQADCIIAADGGANHCTYLDIVPDYLIGDLDSVDQEILKIYEKKQTQIKRYPRAKDKTDLELALELAMRGGATEIYLLGVLGKRWDMSIANIMLAASDRFCDIEISLFTYDCVIKILHPQRTYTFHNKQGKTVSFLPLNTNVTTVSLQGFIYPLNSENLPLGSTRGVSNIIRDAQATERHNTGLLLCVDHINS